MILGWKHVENGWPGAERALLILVSAALLLGADFGVLGVSTRGAPDCGAVPDSLRDARIVDDRDSVGVEVVAYWIRVDSTRASGAYEGSTLTDEGVRADGIVRFYWPSLEQGRYAVSMCSPALTDSELATNVPVRIRHAEGSRRLTLDQRARAGQWVRLGTVRFERRREAFVEIRNDAADGHVVADAVAFHRVDD